MIEAAGSAVSSAPTRDSRSANRDYYYLGGEPLHIGIYLDLVKRLGELGMVCHLVPRVRLYLSPMANWRAWKERNQIGSTPLETVRGRAPGRVHQLPMWALVPEISAPLLLRIVGRDRGRTVVLHARQMMMGDVALALKRLRPNVRVITELEGDQAAELEYKRAGLTGVSPLTRLRWKFEDAYFARQERRLVHSSDVILCVSQHLKNLFIDRYRLTAAQAERLQVFPGVASRQDFFFDPEKRHRVRRALGLEDRFIVVYNGNLGAKWQVPEKLMETFVLIRRSRPDACFLILTPERDRPIAERLAKQHGLSPQDTRVTTLPHGQIAEHLCAADVGLLLRERHLMNQVASPSKFAEYVLSGLPLVMTDGIGDFSGLMRGSPFACLLDGLDDLELREGEIQAFCAKNFSDGQRAEFSRWGGERFATELSVPRLAETYRYV